MLGRSVVTPWTVACQAPLAMGLSRQEYLSRLPFPSPGDPPHLGIKPVSLVSPTLKGEFLTAEPPGIVLGDLGKSNCKSQFFKYVLGWPESSCVFLSFDWLESSFRFFKWKNQYLASGSLPLHLKRLLAWKHYL